MAVDKLVDSSQLDADLTSVANAIRAKGGTSASLAFPSGFVSAIGNIPGGGGTESFSFRNIVVPSAKSVIQSFIPNLLGSGGCIHIKFALQANTATSEDTQIIGIGCGALNAWSPGANNPALYCLVMRSSTTVQFYCRGAGNDVWNVTSEAVNSVLDLKLYSNAYVNVNTSETKTYPQFAQTFMTALASHNYLGFGVNQSTPLSGAVIALVAMEAS